MRNLHSVPRPNPARDFTAFAHDYLGLSETAAWRRAVEGRFLNFPLESPISVAFDPAADPPTLIRRTYEATERAYLIMRDLTRAVRMLETSAVSRSPYVALTISGDDWNILRREMSPYMMETSFGREGTEPRFMGLRLLIMPSRAY